MNDDFEQKLSRQPLRRVPAGWRVEILTAAESAAATRHPSPITRPSWLSTLNHQLSTLLWPHPKAWAGLAAIWILIFAVDFSLRDKTPVMAEKTAPPSPEVIVELRQQQRLLAELIGPRDTSVADRSKPLVPQPRSERGEIVMV
ncbi:MAG: hypothetical protein ACLPYZ_08245 [Limisphaerales bacterium]